MIRLIPDEIVDVFPAVFNMDDPRNKGYFQTEHFKTIVKNIKEKPFDASFSAFNYLYKR